MAATGASGRFYDGFEESPFNFSSGRPYSCRLHGVRMNRCTVAIRSSVVLSFNDGGWTLRSLATVSCWSSPNPPASADSSLVERKRIRKLNLFLACPPELYCYKAHEYCNIYRRPAPDYDSGSGKHFPEVYGMPHEAIWSPCHQRPRFHRDAERAAQCPHTPYREDG